MAKKNIVVIGGSTGSIDILKLLVRKLPRDFDACLFAVTHVSEDSSNYLARILNYSGNIRAEIVSEKTKIQSGYLYLPESGSHLAFHDGMVYPSAQPRENRFRPAIDVLFRTAAQAYGPRVIGVLLTGYLDDGTSGLGIIKEAGGTTIVQDPADAMVSSMPENALEAVEVDYCVPASALPELLMKLVHENVKTNGKVAKSTMKGVSNPADNPPSRFTCPDCGGTLFEVEEGKLKRFRCRVGHAYSEKSLLIAQDDNVENLLWAAQRALEERADMLDRLASRYAKKGQEILQRRFSGRAKKSNQQAEMLRELLEPETEPDHSKAAAS
jgi:two-component system, chemotaxis family, protein-glutamate methylesterase/glutaminase